MGTQERGDAAVVTCPGKKRGGGSHQVRSGRARWREVRRRQSFTVGGHREREREERGVAVVREREGDA